VQNIHSQHNAIYGCLPAALFRKGLFKTQQSACRPKHLLYLIDDK